MLGPDELNAESQNLRILLAAYMNQNCFISCLLKAHFQLWLQLAGHWPSTNPFCPTIMNLFFDCLPLPTSSQTIDYPNSFKALGLCWLQPGTCPAIASQVYLLRYFLSTSYNNVIKACSMRCILVKKLLEYCIILRNFWHHRF